MDLNKINSSLCRHHVKNIPRLAPKTLYKAHAFRVLVALNHDSLLRATNAQNA